MMKKIITFLCIVSLLIPSISTVYSNELDDLLKKKQTLINLEIIDEENADKKFSNDLYIGALIAMKTNDDIRISDYAYSHGILDSLEGYEPDGPVTFAQAVKYAVRTLGYSPMITNENDYVAYARDLGVLEGLEYDENKSISNAEGIKLLYNIKDLSPLVICGYGWETLFEVSEKSIIAEYRKINKIKGVLTGIERTLLTSDVGTSEGTISISNQVYDAVENINEDLLGKNIVGYIQLDDEPKVLHIEEDIKRNKEIYVEAEDVVDVAEDVSTIEYSLNDRKKTAKISDVVRVIYNGVFFGGYTYLDLNPESGSIRMIDNTSDGVIDVIFVTDIKTMVVESKISQRMVINNKISVLDSLASINLYEKEYRILKNGKEISFEEIKVNDILSVAISKGTEPYTEIYVSDKIEKSVVDAKNDREITVGEIEYKVNPIVNEYILQSGNLLPMGKEITLYFDFKDALVYFETEIESEYYVFFKSYYNAKMDKYVINYLTADNEWKITEINKKATIDNQRVVSEEDSCNYLSTLSPQVVKMTFNKKGELRTFTTAVSSTTYMENVFTKTTINNKMYRPNANAFEGTYLIDDNSVLFLFPENDPMNKEGYRAVNPSAYFREYYYSPTAYDIDEYNFAKAFSTVDYANLKSLKKNNSLCVVLGKVLTINDDNEEIDEFKVSFGQRTSVKLRTKPGTNLNFTKGDIVTILLDEDGRLENMYPVASANDTTVRTSPGTGFFNIGYGVGTVSKIGDGKISFTFNEKFGCRLNPSAIVRIYDQDMNQIEFGTVADIVREDYVVCRFSNGTIAEIVIMR